MAVSKASVISRSLAVVSGCTSMVACAKLSLLFVKVFSLSGIHSTVSFFLLSLVVHRSAVLVPAQLLV